MTCLHKFRSKLWRYHGHAGWYFVTLPKKLSVQIRNNHTKDEEGWGRLKTAAAINNYRWQTAIWYDTKLGAYLLPVKAIVRGALKLTVGTQINVVLQIETGLESDS